MTEATPYLVLGGGVTGLYAALTLARGGHPVLLLERKPQVGGLSTSIERDGNPHDFGVHMLHGHDAALRDDVLALMGAQAHPVALDARIRWRGHDFRYPLRFADLLHAMPPMELAAGIGGLLVAGVKKPLRLTPSPRNAEEALIALYGAPLYRSFFADFTARYWGRPPRDLSASFVARKMPRLTAVDALRQALSAVGIKLPAPRVESALTEETLYYSRRGAGALPEALAREIQRLGGEIVTHAHVQALDLATADAPAVAYAQAGQGWRRRVFRRCVATIPLGTLIGLLGQGVPAAVRASAGRLEYRPTAVYGLLVARERCMAGLYMYFRERCFHRVSEPKNAGVVIQPANHSLLLVERMCAPGDAVWRGGAEAIQETIAALAGEGLCRPEEVVSVAVQAERHAYPVFALGFESHLARVLSWMEGQTPIRCAGRQGTFSYPNMHEAMREGQAAAAELAASGV